MRVRFMDCLRAGRGDEGMEGFREEVRGMCNGGKIRERAAEMLDSWVCGV
jgi:hypothetical protein